MKELLAAMDSMKERNDSEELELRALLSKKRLIEKEKERVNLLKFRTGQFPGALKKHWGLTPLRKCYDSYISTMNRVDTFLVCAYNPYNSIYFGRA